MMLSKRIATMRVTKRSCSSSYRPRLRKNRQKRRLWRKLRRKQKRISARNGSGAIFLSVPVILNAIMADIAWHVSLVRFITFGCHYLYQDLPNVALYVKAVISQKALKSATFSWPGYFPSPNLTSILKSEVSIWAAEKNQLKIVLLSYFAGFGLGTFELTKYFFTGKIPQTMIVVIGLWIGYKSGIYKNANKPSLTNIMVYFQQRMLK